MFVGAVELLDRLLSLTKVRVKISHLAPSSLITRPIVWSVWERSNEVRDNSEYHISLISCRRFNWHRLTQVVQMKTKHLHVAAVACLLISSKCHLEEAV